MPVNRSAKNVKIYKEQKTGQKFVREEQNRQLRAQQQHIVNLKKVCLPVKHAPYQKVNRNINIEDYIGKFDRIHVTEKIHGSNITLYIFKNLWEVVTRNGKNGDDFKLRQWFERVYVSKIKEIQQRIPQDKIVPIQPDYDTQNDHEKAFSHRHYYYKIVGEFYSGGENGTVCVQTRLFKKYGVKFIDESDNNYRIIDVARCYYDLNAMNNNEVKENIYSEYATDDATLYDNKVLGFTKMQTFCEQLNLETVLLIDEESSGLKNTILESDLMNDMDQEHEEEGDGTDDCNGESVEYKKLFTALSKLCKSWQKTDILKIKSSIYISVPEGFVVRFEDKNGYTIYPYIKYTIGQP